MTIEEVFAMLQRSDNRQFQANQGFMIIIQQLTDIVSEQKEEIARLKWRIDGLERQANNTEHALRTHTNYHE